jgi:hypothetical protein
MDDWSRGRGDRTSCNKSKKPLGAFFVEATRSSALACLVFRLDPLGVFFCVGPGIHSTVDAPSS